MDQKAKPKLRGNFQFVAEITEYGPVGLDLRSEAVSSRSLPSPDCSSWQFTLFKTLNLSSLGGYQYDLIFANLLVCVM
jgi:hypothetical protein